MLKVRFKIKINEQNTDYDEDDDFGVLAGMYFQRGHTFAFGVGHG